MRSGPWPVRPLQLVVLAAGVVALTFQHSREQLQWAYADPVAVSAEFRQALTLGGLWVAGSSAWAATTFAPARLAYCPDGCRRKGPGLVVAQVGVLWAVAALGLALGLAPVTASVVTAGAGSGLQPAVIVSGVAALAVFVAGGYAIGCVAPAALAAPLAAAAGFAAIVLSGPNGLVTSLVWPFGMEAGLSHPAGVTAFRTGFFVVAAVLLGAAAAWWLAERSSRVSPLLVVGAATLLVPIVVVGHVTNDRIQTLVSRDLSSTPVCQVTGNAVSVCVHPARAGLLAPLTARVQAVTDVLGADVSDLDEVEDATTWKDPRPGRVNLQLQTNDRDTWLDRATGDLASVIAGVHECYQVDIDLDPAGPSAASDAVAGWILVQVGVPPDDVVANPAAADALAAMLELPEGQVRSYVIEQIDEFRACRGSLAPLL